MPSSSENSCCSGGCDCGPNSSLGNRDVVKRAGNGATGLSIAASSVMAGPFARTDFDRLVPADKKLSPGWIDSLTARGEPDVYRGDELTHIGMPVGGIGAGQVYLGGDGRLWHWDIFNQHIGTGDSHYAHPMSPEFPFEFGFEIQIDQDTRPIDSNGFADVRFCGQYPIGRVDYRDEGCPLSISLEAFSPFIPLNTDDSSLPATVLRYTLTNPTPKPIRASVVGRLENAIGLHHREYSAVRKNRTTSIDACTILECTGEPIAPPPPSSRSDIVFEVWNHPTYADWTVTGTAFGAGPLLKSDLPNYLGNVGGDTQRVVNSHAAAPGDTIEQRDQATGTLTSRAFRIDRHFINLWIGGGGHKGQTCVNLVVDGKVESSLVGPNSNKMTARSIDVRRFSGKQARLEIVDNATGGWGYIAVGRIWFGDAAWNETPFEQASDTGSMALALLDAPADIVDADRSVPYHEKLVSRLGAHVSLAPGQSRTITFVLAWHFPNLKMDRLPGGRFYATRFASAVEVAGYVARDFDRLYNQTRLWRDTWYDSTLPYWFLDRTFLNTSILASSTCFLFKDRRFYGWEGVGCCAGTCGHVWMYAQAVARLFPDLERNLREVADFAVSMKPDGAIVFRGEHNDIPAVDSQAGTILRCLREHQMSPDNAFLRRNWNSIKRAMQWLIDKDGNDDGLIESNQHNTLDSDWFGQIAWLSGLYVAALAAAEVMAREMNDDAFAARCRTIFNAGRNNLVTQLFDGEYFINKPDANHLDSINSGTGCHIDQVFGQSWAFQVNLGRVLPEKQTRSALSALWKYNFIPDVGPYRATNKPGRWYAMAGEAGLLMCTFPRTDWDYEKAGGQGKGHKTFTGYFNECMNGFEYQVAGHMIWEGFVLEGLAITRAVHDRYHPLRRNPWNEVECGDHYSRSMASYGVFLAACGFEYHGPQGHVGFFPRIGSGHFKAPFTTAQGWGTFELTGSRCTIRLRWGTLTLSSIGLPATNAKSCVVRIDDKPVASTLEQRDEKPCIRLTHAVTLSAGGCLSVEWNP